MRKLTTLMLGLTAMLAISMTPYREVPPYGNLYLTNLPAQASDLDITFSQPPHAPIHVLGSQMGYTPGAVTITVPAAAAATHFGAAGYDPTQEMVIKIGLLDETGDAITSPGSVTGGFFMNPNGATVVDYLAL